MSALFVCPELVASDSPYLPWILFLPHDATFPHLRQRHHCLSCPHRGKLECSHLAVDAEPLNVVGLSPSALKGSPSSLPRPFVFALLPSTLTSHHFFLHSPLAIKEHKGGLREPIHLYDDGTSFFAAAPAVGWPRDGASPCVVSETAFFRFRDPAPALSR